MGTRKTDADIAREEIALGMYETTRGTNISVTSGGQTNPYQVTLGRLNRKEMEAVVKLLLEWIAEERRKHGEDAP